MPGDVASKDVVIATMGATAGLVGFVLVFLGILVTTYQSLLGSLGRPALAPLRRTAWSSLTVTSLGLVSLVVSSAWLVAGGGHALYVVSLVLFFLELVAVVVVAVTTCVILLK